MWAMPSSRAGEAAGKAGAGGSRQVCLGDVFTFHVGGYGAGGGAGVQCMSAEGVSDMRVYVESHVPGVDVPWNLARARFQLVPRLAYDAQREAEAAAQAAAEADEGPGGKGASKRGRDAQGEGKLGQLQAGAEAEVKENKDRVARERGAELAFGGEVQLVHVESGMHVTVQRVPSRANVRHLLVMLVEGGSAGSWFKLMPGRGSVQTVGETVVYGDAVRLASIKFPRYSLSLNGIEATGAHPYVSETFEVSAGEVATEFAMQRYARATDIGKGGGGERVGAETGEDGTPGGGPEAKAGALAKCGDRIVIYNRAAEAMLMMVDTELEGGSKVQNLRPLWRRANLGSVRTRPDLVDVSALWVFEAADGCEDAGGPIALTLPDGEPRPLRLRHVATGRVLSLIEGSPGGAGVDTEELFCGNVLRVGGKPSVTAHSRALWRLRSTNTRDSGKVLTRASYGELLYLDWLGGAPHAQQSMSLGVLEGDTLERVGQFGDTPAHVAGTQFEDVVELFRVPDAALKEALQCRDLLQRMKKFEDELRAEVRPLEKHAELVRTCPPPGKDAKSVSARQVWFDKVEVAAEASGLWGVCNRHDALNSNMDAVDDPREGRLKGAISLQATLSKLLKYLVPDGSGTLITWAGVPDSRRQDVFRQLRGMDVMMGCLDAIYGEGTGLPPPFIDAKGRIALGLLLTSRLMHRILQLALDGHNASRLYLGGNARYVAMLQWQLGTEMRSANTVLAVMEDNLEFLERMQTKHIDRFLNLMESMPMPRFVQFVAKTLICKGSPIPQNQDRVLHLLLSTRVPPDADLVPQTGGGGSSIFSRSAQPRDAKDNGESGDSADISARAVELERVPGLDGAKDVYKVRRSVVARLRIDSRPLPDRDFPEEPTVMVKHPSADLEVDLRQWFGRADALLRTDTSVNSPEEILFRYFLAQLHLLANMCRGRNRRAINSVLRRSKHLGCTWEDLEVMTHGVRIPYVIRAAALDLLVILYVDRDPRFPVSPVNLTLIYPHSSGEHHGRNDDLHTAVIEEGSGTDTKTMKGGGFMAGPIEKTLPPRPDSLADPWIGLESRRPPTKTFSDLRETLMKYLQTRLDTEGGFDLALHGQNIMTRGVVRALTTLMQLGFFWKTIDDKNDSPFMLDQSGRGEPDFVQLGRLVNVIVPFLDGRRDITGPALPSATGAPQQASSGQARERGGASRFSKRSVLSATVIAAKIDMCRLLEICFDCRLARRIQMSFEVFARNAQRTIVPFSQDPLDYTPEDDAVNEAVDTMFGRPIIGPLVSFVRIIPREGNLPLFVEALLDCLRYENLDLTRTAARILYDHLAQPAAFTRNVCRTMVLHGEADVGTFHAVVRNVAELDERKKWLQSADEVQRSLAITRNRAIFQGFYDLCMPHADPSAVVILYCGSEQIRRRRDPQTCAVNVAILSNAGALDRAMDVMSLPMLRQQNSKPGVQDEPVDPIRRDLFQDVLFFLRASCWNGHTTFPANQEAVWGHVHSLSQHMGIRGLNVGDTLVASITDNRTTSAQVTPAQLGRFVDLIRRYGHQPRWLRFLLAACSVSGRVVEENQLAILGLLMVHKERVLVLCAEEDALKKRAEWMADVEPRWEKSGAETPAAYLATTMGEPLLYHLSCIKLLSACCMGKNAMNKIKVAALLPARNIISSMLDLHVYADKAGVKRAGWAMLLMVKEVYCGALHTVFTDAINDLASAEMDSDSNRFWIGLNSGDTSLIDSMLSDVQLATDEDAGLDVRNAHRRYALDCVLPMLRSYMEKHFNRDIFYRHPDTKGKFEALMSAFRLIAHSDSVRPSERKAVYKLLKAGKVDRDISLLIAGRRDTTANDSKAPDKVQSTISPESLEPRGVLAACWISFYSEVVSSLGVKGTHQQPIGKGARNLAYLLSRADAKTGEPEVVPGSVPPITYASLAGHLARLLTDGHLQDSGEEGVIEPGVVGSYLGIFNGLIYVDDPRKQEERAGSYAMFEEHYMRFNVTKEPPKFFDVTLEPGLGVTQILSREHKLAHLMEWTQAKYISLGVGTFAISRIADPHPAVRRPAVKLLGALLSGTLSLSEDDYTASPDFFQGIHVQLSSGVVELGHLKKALTRHLESDYVVSGDGNTSSDESDPQAISWIRESRAEFARDVSSGIEVVDNLRSTLYMMQMMCDRGNMGMQELMMNQPLNAQSYNLLEDAHELVVHSIPILTTLHRLARMYGDDMPKGYPTCWREFDRAYLAYMVQALNTLNEVVEGPCPRSQNFLVLNTYAVTTVMSILRTCAYDEGGSFHEKQYVVPGKYAGKLAPEESRNDLLCDVRIGCLILLRSFFEGMDFDDAQRGMELCDKIHVPTLVDRARESLEWYRSGGSHCEALQVEIGISLFTMEAVREWNNSMKRESTTLEDVLAECSKEPIDLGPRGSAHGFSAGHPHAGKRDPVLYFSSHDVCSVEIYWRGHVYNHGFLLSNATRKLMSDVEWKSQVNQDVIAEVLKNDKDGAAWDDPIVRQHNILRELQKRIFGVEHIHRCFDGGGPLARWAILNRVHISRAGFLPAFIIYTLLMVGYGEDFYTWRESWTLLVITVLGAIQGAAALATLVLHVYVEGPIILQRMHDERLDSRQELAILNAGSSGAQAPGDDVGENVDLDHVKVDVLDSDAGRVRPPPTGKGDALGRGDSSPRTLNLVFTVELWYLVVLVAGSALGLASCATALLRMSPSALLVPFWFLPQLLDAFRWPSMRALSQALYVGGPDLLFTMAMAMLILLLFAAFSFLAFNAPLYSGEAKPCDTFYSCVSNHFIGAFGEGTLEESVVGSSLAFPVMAAIDENPSVQVRSAYMHFFRFFWTVFLSALFGAQIVDAYGAIRQREGEIRDRLRSGCFLCNTESTLLDSAHGPGAFRRHVDQDHNLAHYVFFLQYLREKSEDTHTGIEAYVAECASNQVASWLPLGTCYSLLHDKARADAQQGP